MVTASPAYREGRARSKAKKNSNTDLNNPEAI